MKEEAPLNILHAPLISFFSLKKSYSLGQKWPLKLSCAWGGVQEGVGIMACYRWMQCEKLGPGRKRLLAEDLTWKAESLSLQLLPPLSASWPPCFAQLSSSRPFFHAISSLGPAKHGLGPLKTISQHQSLLLVAEVVRYFVLPGM